MDAFIWVMILSLSLFGVTYSAVTDDTGLMFVSMLSLMLCVFRLVLWLHVVMKVF